MDNLEEKIEGIKDESVPYEVVHKERRLVTTKLEDVRKRKDGYYNVKIGNTGRTAIVPKDTLERLIKEETSFRVLKDRCNTLSALHHDFDRPLMYYAIVAYNLVPKEEWSKWESSTPLLTYELTHLNGNIDDIREENVKIALRDIKVWEEVKEEFKSKNKVGADIEYTKRREEFLKAKYTEYPNLKVMTRVTDPVKKTKGGRQIDISNYSKELQETIS